MFALLAAAIAFVHFREKPVEAPVTRFSIAPPDKVHFSGSVPVVSPDGRQVVFEATGGKSQLWLRPLDSLTAQPMAGTENATFPFWSPDSQWIGFFAGGKLKKMSASGGPVTVLADAPNGRGGTWSLAGVILFAPAQASGLATVSASGGDARIVLPRGRKNQRFPRFLPDGRHFLYLLGNAGDYVIAVGSLDLPKDGQPLPGVVNSFAEYADGRLVYLQGDTLVARAFDAKKMAYTGDAVTLAEQVVPSSGRTTAAARFSASGNGVLVYQRASNDFQLTWLDRAGKRLGTVGEAGDLAQPRFSPDRTNVAVSIREASGGASDIWLYDVPHGLRTRLTFQTTSALNQTPVWSPDGAVIFFRSDGGGETRIVRKRADGSGGEELLLSSTSAKFPYSFSPDGKYLAYRDLGDATARDVWILPDPLGKPGMSKPFPFMRTEFSEDDPQFSPDGHWIAYLSNESGRNEVYVAPFPGPGGKRQISTAGGTRPLWRPDGKELFYLAADNRLMAVEVEVKGSVFEVKKVEALFGPLTGIGYDVSADGQRFLAAIAPEGQVDEPLTVVQNWPAGLKK